MGDKIIPRPGPHTPELNMILSKRTETVYQWQCHTCFKKMKTPAHIKKAITRACLCGSNVFTPAMGWVVYSHTVPKGKVAMAQLPPSLDAQKIADVVNKMLGL
jgi:hypothetical protein